LKPPPEEHQNGIIAGYSALVVRMGTSDSMLLVVNTTNTLLEVNNLRPSTQYNFTAAAYTSAGIGAYTEPVLITTLQSPTSENIYTHTHVTQPVWDKLCPYLRNI